METQPSPPLFAVMIVSVLTSGARVCLLGLLLRTLIPVEHDSLNHGHILAMVVMAMVSQAFISNHRKLVKALSLITTLALLCPLSRAIAPFGSLELLQQLPFLAALQTCHQIAFWQLLSLDSPSKKTS